MIIQNIYIHFIYGPPKEQEAKEFWQKVESNFNKKKTNKDKHILIGDLNIQIEKRDSSSGQKIKLPKALKNIIKTNNLVDAYKLKNKNKNGFTYFNIRDEDIIQSKLDYTMLPIDMEHIWHSPKIHKINKNISQDHRPIEITLQTQVKLEKIQKQNNIKTIKMVTKDVKKEIIQEIQTLSKQTFESTKWKNFEKEDDKITDINKLLEEYEKDIWNIANGVLDMKVTSSNPAIKSKLLSPQRKENIHNQNVITKAILSVKKAVLQKKKMINL